MPETQKMSGEGMLENVTSKPETQTFGHLLVPTENLKGNEVLTPTPASKPAPSPNSTFIAITSFIAMLEPAMAGFQKQAPPHVVLAAVNFLNALKQWQKELEPKK
jgi:hypothetical protein